MKSSILFFINCYQRLLSPLLKQILGIQSYCRYSPSCSAYAAHAIQAHGVRKGSWLAIKRFLRCQPFTQTYEYI